MSTQSDRFSARGFPRVVVMPKELIYTRWVRAYDQRKAIPRWYGANVQLYLRRDFRLGLRFFGLDLTVCPIRRSEWDRVRPQHVLGIEFDRPTASRTPQAGPQ